MPQPLCIIPQLDRARGHYGIDKTILLIIRQIMTLYFKKIQRGQGLLCSYRLSLDKIGCISTRKIKVFGLLFCFVFDLNKNLTLKKDNLFSFSSLNRFFALSLDKIGCISTRKIKVFGLLFCFVFDLHYLCSRIVGISLLQQSENHGYIY